jgi:hypothetical protein
VLNDILAESPIRRPDATIDQRLGFAAAQLGTNRGAVVAIDPQRRDPGHRLDAATTRPASPAILPLAGPFDAVAARRQSVPGPDPAGHTPPVRS